MQKGLILKHDADFDYAIHFKSTVEVRVGSHLDYSGPLMGFTQDYIVTDQGDRYLRATCEFRIA